MRVMGLASSEWDKYGISLVVLIGFVFGIVGSGIGQYGLAVISTAVLVVLFGAYHSTFKHSNGILGGVSAGGLLGLLVSVISLPLSHNISGIGDGALFGLFSGAVIGGTIGFIIKKKL